jgi:peptide/nickel transport system substrate-binding protein
MARFNSDRRGIALLLATLAVIGAGSLVAPRVGKGQQQPAPGELLKMAPFDRITLTDGLILDVEPISPRPLPSFDPARDDTAKKESPTTDTKTGTTKDGNVPPPAKSKKNQPKGKKDEPPQINELFVHRLEGEVRDFRIRRAHIKKVEYFEDLLLAEGERLVQIRDYSKAFEHYLAIQIRNPAWKGLDEHIDQLLYEEGTWALTEDPDRGQRLLRELYLRKPKYPRLLEKLADAYGTRIDRAIKAHAYRDARRILHELEGIDPNGARTGEGKAQLVSRAKELADQAAKAKGSDKVDRLTEALRVWPKLEGAAESYNTAFSSDPTLDVGVIDLPRPVAPWIRTDASERVARLLYRPLLSKDDEDALKGKYTDQVAGSMEVTDLGRRLVIQIRDGIAWTDGTRSLSAIDMIRSLSDRAEPRSPAYNARWAELLERVQANDDHQIEIRLTRAPLRVESWLQGPVGPAHASWDGWVAIPGRGREPVSDGPFRWESETKSLMTYRAVAAGSAPGTKILRIREHRLATAGQAVGALLRGEVTVLEHVSPDRLSSLAEDKDIKVGKYARPALHRIALDGRNPILRNRSLRRGLSSSIDRKTILEETVLRRPLDSASPNAPADGPFPFDSYANAPDVKPLTYDPLIAKMLVTMARKEIGAPIKLTFEYPAIPEAQLAVPKIAEAFINAGVELKLIERPASELEDSLRSGRLFDLAYRVSSMAEPALDVGPFICPPYDAPSSVNGLGAVVSPRILQLMLELEHAPDSQTGRATLVLIDRECRDELPVIPLWQLEDHYAWRARLKGPAEQTERLYEGIEGWDIEPWFAKDPW